MNWLMMFYVRTSWHEFFSTWITLYHFYSGNCFIVNIFAMIYIFFPSINCHLARFAFKKFKPKPFSFWNCFVMNIFAMIYIFFPSIDWHLATFTFICFTPYSFGYFFISWTLIQNWFFVIISTGSEQKTDPFSWTFAPFFTVFLSLFWNFWQNKSKIRVFFTIYDYTKDREGGGYQMYMQLNKVQ